MYISLSKRRQYFRQIFAKTGSSLRKNANIFAKFLQNWQQFTQNANIFAQFFGENIYKILTSVPFHVFPLLLHSSRK
jgi:hypothetical protein